VSSIAVLVIAVGAIGLLAATGHLNLSLKKSASDAQNANAPNVEAPKMVSVTGEAWVKKTSGETLSLAIEQVYLLPVSLHISRPNNDFDGGVAYLQNRVNLASEMPDNVIAVATAKDATPAFNRIKPYVNSDSVPTMAVISACIDTISLAAAHDRLAKAAGMPPSLSNETEEAIRFDYFWKVATSRPISRIDTGRDGRFTFDNVPSDKYIIGCKVDNPALKGVVFWAVEIDTSGGNNVKIDLTPTNAKVINH
jgi:hypothetical protein